MQPPDPGDKVLILPDKAAHTDCKMNPVSARCFLLILGLTAVLLTGCTQTGRSSGSSGTGTELAAAPEKKFMPHGSGLFVGADQEKALRLVRTGEFLRSGALDMVDAEYAFAYGIKGAGAKVAVLDTGIDLQHSDLPGSLAGGSTSIVSDSLDEHQTRDHGSMVAGLIAAREDGRGIVGIAPEAGLMVIKMTDEGGVSEALQTEAIHAAVDGGADIINISYGLSGYSDYDLETMIRDGVLSDGLLAAYARAIENDTLIVHAAGNTRKDNPDWDGKLAGYGLANGQMLVVGALDATGHNLAVWSGAYGSHKAGDAKNFFLTAPGTNLITTMNNGQYSEQERSNGTVSGTASGTSFAAPLVAGAAALVKSAAPFLSAQEVAAILLTSADDLGAKGVDDVFGHGRLNVRKALMPQGQVIVPLGAGASVNKTAAAGGVLSNVLAGSAALKSTLVTDGFGRPFSMNLAPESRRPVSDALTSDWLAKPIQESERPDTGVASLRFSGGQKSTSLTLAEGRNWASALTGKAAKGHLAISDSAMGFAAQRSLSDLANLRFGFAADKTFRRGEGTRIAFASLERKLPEKSALSLTFGNSWEDGSQLGTHLGGAFATGKTSETAFLKLDFSRQLGRNWQADLSYSLGRSRNFSGGAGLITAQKGAVSDRAELSFTRRTATSSLKLGFVRELGFTGGKMVLNVPTSHSMTREAIIGYSQETLKLKTARRVTAGLDYTQAVNDNTDLALMAAVSMNERDADDVTWAAGAKMHIRF